MLQRFKIPAYSRILSWSSLAPPLPPLPCLLRRSSWTAACAENHLHNPAFRVTILPLETRTTSCPIPVKVHRVPYGKRFYAHESLEIWLSTILEYKFILLWRNSTAGFDLTMCVNIRQNGSRTTLWQVHTFSYQRYCRILQHYSLMFLRIGILPFLMLCMKRYCEQMVQHKYE